MMIARIEPKDVCEALISEVVAVQERGVVNELEAIFPQAEFPFPREAICDRWRNELSDETIHAFIARNDEGHVAGFGVSQMSEFLHFGTAVETWGTGLARELHDHVVNDMLAGFGDAEHFHLKVFESNTRARRFYEKCGWQDSNIKSQTEFPPHPTLVEYRFTR